MPRKQDKSPTHVERANEYARRVLSGDIPACEWIKLACRRHFDDLDAGVYRFDDVRAEKAARFISLMPHTKGKWALPNPKEPGSHLTRLEPWQCFFVCSIFGWLKGDGTRRFQKASLYVPRKNGKSHLAAAIGLYMLCADSEPGSEVYCGATSEKQAWEVFGPAHRMASKTPALVERYGLEINARNMNVRSENSKFEPVIGNPGDGASPHCAIIDEFHEHRTTALYNAMLTGMGAREQPLLLVITTAGEDLSSPCYNDFKTCQQVLSGSISDPEHFALIYTIDESDAWDDEKTLIKANPNFGVSVKKEFLLSRLNEARTNARHQGRYKTKHLNMWVTALDSFFNLEAWRKADADVSLEDFDGECVYIGMDLASKVDLAVVVVLVPPSSNGGDWHTFAKFYLPEQTVAQTENEHYREWAEGGHITVTDGAIIDFDVIKADLIDLCTRFECLSLPYDPYQATKLVTELQSEGLPVIEMRSTVLNFSDPMKMLDGLIRDGKIVHDGNPVMTWMIGNVVATHDAKDNVFPRKNRDEDKIDGPVALIMAMARAMVGEVAAPEPSAIWLGQGAYDDSVRQGF